MLIRYVTALRVSPCHAFKLCTKFEQNQIIHRWSSYWQFSTFSP